jgi:hypothetical protein
MEHYIYKKVHLRKLRQLQDVEVFCLFDYCWLYTKQFSHQFWFLSITNLFTPANHILKNNKGSLQNKIEKMEFTLLGWLAGVLAGHFPDQKKLSVFLASKLSTCSGRLELGKYVDLNNNLSHKCIIGCLRFICCHLCCV